MDADDRQLPRPEGAVFMVVGTLGPGIPVAIYFAMGERAERLLEGMKAWMGAHNAAISHP